MKSKFIGTFIAIAVVLSMVMVPAIPGVAVAAAGDSGLVIVPQETKVGFTEDFDLEIWTDIVGNFDGVGAYLNFSPTYMSVNSITPSGNLPMGLESAFDNTNGTINYAAGSLSPVSGDTLVITINCTSTSNTGISAIDFVIDGVLRTTDVTSLGGSILNWTMVVNGTLKVGSPALTVDVSPAGKGDVDITGSSIPSSYPNVSYWSWDQTVNLEAVNPAAGWAFDSWSGDLTGSTNPDSVTMSDAKSVTANFVELPPALDVDPTSLSFSARFGDNEDNGTVDISNTGGGTLCWSLGTPPVWTAGDNWTYMNLYSFYPPGTPFPNPYYVSGLPCVVNDTVLVMTVTGQTADNYVAVADWPMADPQRSIKGGIPACLKDASVLIDKATLDYVQQLANLTIYMGPPPGLNSSALVSWAYDGCHGWPYNIGKSWTYNITIVDALGTTVTPAQAMVTDGPLNPAHPIAGGLTDVMEITHGSPNLGGQVFMQQYWSDTVRSFVYQWDAGTFDAPPLDERALLGFNVAAPAATAPPAWLSFDKISGALGIGGSETLTATANTSGLAVGIYNGSFTITAPGSLQTETVDCTLEVLEATTIDVIRDLPADALNQDAEYPGDTFYVWVNFTAPVDDFNAVGLTDLAPAGWDVHTDVSWCNPVADWTLSPGNKAEYAWNGPYGVGQVFSAKYLVTIPATADVGLNDWPDGDCAQAWAEYWFAAVGPFESCITGEWQKIVTVPGTVCGETRDVNADLLTSTMVRLYEEVMVYEDDDSSTAPDALYCNDVDDTGQYWQSASKYCYFTLDTNVMPGSRNPNYPLNIDFSTVALLAVGYTMDFEGDYGLVPRACTMSYAMESVNHWLFVPIDGMAVPHSEWKLSSWKAMESVHSWQFPAGCNL